MPYTRRDFGKLALAAVPLARLRAAAKIDSKFQGVQIGAITYSFNSIANPDPEAIIRAYVEIGLGEAELMSNHCEALAGAPRAGAVAAGGAPLSRPSSRPPVRRSRSRFAPGAPLPTPPPGRTSARSSTTPASKWRCSATT